MSDPSGLPPEQDAALRRLLAAARHDEPIPDDVVARLDVVLARFREEPVAPDDVDPTNPETTDPTDPTDATDETPHPIDLDAARRRRGTAVRVLVAAAVLVVVGAGYGAIRPHLGSGSPTATSADSATAGSVSPDLLGDSPADLPAAGSGRLRGGSTPSGDAGRLPRLTRSGFAVQAARLRERTLSAASPAPVSPDHADLAAQGAPAARAARGCPTDVGPGRAILVSYGPDVAVLVLRPAAGDTQVADLVACAPPYDTLRSVTLAFAGAPR